MKRLFLSSLLSLTMVAASFGQTQAFFINDGVITFPPQVDATNFVNNGTITIQTALPFDTSNTINFTNRGSMTGTVGWRLDTAPTNNGERRAAAVVRNHTGASIRANDSIFDPSQLIVNATNIINSGIFTVGASGLLSLNGRGTDLTRGGVEVRPIQGRGTGPSGGGRFSPDIGILDNYWGIDTMVLNSGNILTFFGTNFFVVSPVHQVADLFRNFAFQVGAADPLAFVFTNAGPTSSITLTNSDGSTTNALISTNVSVQAAFVSLLDTNVGARARFFPSSIQTNLFHTVTVEFTVGVTNAVTGVTDVATVYFLDQLASETNRTLLANQAVFPSTFRPSSYEVSRLMPGEFAFGDAENSVLTTNLLFDAATFSNRVVSANYAGYSATVDILATRPPAVPGASFTNTPGRIEIKSDVLDLTRTRFRGDSLVQIKTDHLVSSSNAVMDAHNLVFDLASTNGNLRVQNLAKAQVSRLGGDLFAWSGFWSNRVLLIETNNFGPDPNDPDVLIPTPLTNVINVGFHVLILNADSISTTVPVTTHDFITRSTNVVLADPMVIARSFFTDAERFTIEGTNAVVQLTGTTPDWVSTNAPNVRFFTNSGTLNISNEGHFGDDRPVPYAAFVNRGTNTALGINIKSDYFENAGEMRSSSILWVRTLSGKMENGRSFTGGDLAVEALDFKLRNYTNQSQGAVFFTITNSLSDNGPGANARLITGDGFHVTYGNGTGKPTVGDLLGTTIQTAIPLFASVPHTWPGDDRGATKAGFTNNLALGRLVIAAGFDAEAAFAGAGANNGFYVDFLEFVGINLATLDDAVRIDPNLVIYYADSNLPVEQLDGRLGGRLRWVRDFAGPNSSVDVALPGGQVIKVNRGLRESLIIDSDADGLANGFDPNPFDGVTLTGVSVTTVPPTTALVSWQAAAGTVYRVEFTTNIISPTWQFLLNFTNTATANGVVTVQDVVPAGSPQRYYRVGYNAP